MKVLTAVLGVILVAAVIYLFIGYAALVLPFKILYLVFVLLVVVLLIALIRKIIRGL